MKKRMLKNGFTIAELLITMLIVLVVSAAIVPFIGPKKIKHPRELANHGLFECYWRLEDEQYKLMQYTRAGKNSGIESDSDAVEVTGDGKTNGYCTFNVPKANFFKVEMVGKGGDGYGFDFTTLQQFTNSNIGYSIIDADNYIMPGNYTYSGTIPTLPDSYSSNGDSFESYMGYNGSNNGTVDSLNIPGLRNYYDSVGPLPAAYLAKIGSTVTDDGTTGDNTDPDEEKEYQNVTKGPGIFSLPVYAATTNKNGRYSIFLSWLGKDNSLSFSKFDSKYTISQNNKGYIFQRLNSSSTENTSGTDNHWKNIKDALPEESNTGFCKARNNSDPNISVVLQEFRNMEPLNSKSYFCASSPDVTPTDWGIEPIALSNNSGNGTVNSDGTATGFDYKITLPALQYTYGAGGQSAEIAVQIYPKFQAEQIRVYPAKGNGKTRIVAITPDGEKVLIKSEDGTNGTPTSKNIQAVQNKHPNGINWLEENIKNLPSDLERYVFVKSGPDMGAVFNNIHGKNPLQDSINEYKSSDGTTGTMSPGTGGNGAYKMVNKVNGKTTIELYDSLGENHGNSTNGIPWTKTFNLQEKCTVPSGYSGFEKNVIKSGNSSNDWYCKGTKGAPGAVVITW